MSWFAGLAQLVSEQFASPEERGSTRSLLDTASREFFLFGYVLYFNHNIELKKLKNALISLVLTCDSGLRPADGSGQQQPSAHGHAGAVERAAPLDRAGGAVRVGAAVGRARRAAAGGDTHR